MTYMTFMMQVVEFPEIWWSSHYKPSIFGVPPCTPHLWKLHETPIWWWVSSSLGYWMISANPLWSSLIFIHDTYIFDNFWYTWVRSSPQGDHFSSWSLPPWATLGPRSSRQSPSALPHLTAALGLHRRSSGIQQKSPQKMGGCHGKIHWTIPTSAASYRFSMNWFWKKVKAPGLFPRWFLSIHVELPDELPWVQTMQDDLCIFLLLFIFWASKLISLSLLRNLRKISRPRRRCRWWIVGSAGFNWSGLEDTKRGSWRMGALPRIFQNQPCDGSINP